MNIFVLHEDPEIAAQMQCDAHCVKMVLESAQMLCTTHRVLDGYKNQELSNSKKTLLHRYIHPNDFLNQTLYKTCHINHPCTQWTRECSENYIWLYRHFQALCKEYSYRYNNIHSTELLLSKALSALPKNINVSKNITPFKLAMSSHPECIFPEDPVKSYRLFYKTKEKQFKMIWTKRSKPNWF